MNLADREGAAIGVFLTFEEPTSHMLNEAASAGSSTPTAGTKITPESKS